MRGGGRVGGVGGTESWGGGLGPRGVRLLAQEAWMEREGGTRGQARRIEGAAK